MYHPADDGTTPPLTMGTIISALQDASYDVMEETAQSPIIISVDGVTHTVDSLWVADDGSIHIDLF